MNEAEEDLIKYLIGLLCVRFPGLSQQEWEDILRPAIKQSLSEVRRRLSKSLH